MTNELPPVTIHLMGGLRIRQGTQELSFEGKRELGALLGYLALQNSRKDAKLVTRAQAFFAVYGQELQDDTRGRLRRLLHSLRQILRPFATSEGGVLVETGGHDALALGGHVMTDVAAFRQAVTHAERSAGQEQPADRAQAYIAAVRRYQGELLPGREEPWAVWERAQLAGEYAHALDRSSVLIGERQDADATAVLAQEGVRSAAEMVEQHAGRVLADAGRYAQIDTLRCALMRLYLLARLPARALQQYEALRRALEPFGQTPSATAEQINERARAALPTTHGEQHGPQRSRQRPLLGRDAELGQITRLVSATPRLVTLTGPPGVGKTRLAQAVIAAEPVRDVFSLAVYEVALQSVAAPAQIPEAILAAVGGKRDPRTTPLEQAADALNRAPTLLLLDNFEHLLGEAAREAATATVADLLARAPLLTCLVTSRQLLHLDEPPEQEFPVSPLPVPQPGESVETLRNFPSVQLFAQYARSAQPDFAVTEHNAEPLRRLCAALDGLPLALVLVAVWASVRSPQEMLAELESLKRREAPPRYRRAGQQALSRHPTLQAALQWSYDLLPAEAKRLFPRLSVFRGGWTLQAAEAVCGLGTESRGGTPDGRDSRDDMDDASVLLSLLALQERSLIDQRETGHAGNGGDGETRFFFLETIREYARETLSDPTDSTESGEGDGEPNRLSQHHLRYFAALASEAEPYVEGAEQAHWLGRLEREHDNLRAALAWALDHDPATGLPMATALWRFWEVRDHWGEGLDWLERALKASEGVPEVTPESRGRALNAAGALAVRVGRLPLARSYMEDAVAIWRELGRKDKLALGLSNLGVLAYEQGEFERATACSEEAKAIQERIGDQPNLAKTLNNLAIVSWSQGDLAQARTLYEQSLAIKRDFGEAADLASTLNNLGTVAKEEGDYTAARSRLAESRALLEGIGNGWMAAYVACNLADVARLEGDFADAFTLYDASLDQLVKVNDARAAVVCLEGFAQLAAVERQWERAAWLFGAGRGLRVSLDLPLLPAQEAEYRPALEHTRADLGDDAFAAVVRAGEGATLDEAVRRARTDRAG